MLKRNKIKFKYIFVNIKWNVKFFLIIVVTQTCYIETNLIYLKFFKQTDKYIEEPEPAVTISEELMECCLILR